MVVLSLYNRVFAFNGIPNYTYMYTLNNLDNYETYHCTSKKLNLYYLINIILYIQGALVIGIST